MVQIDERRTQGEGELTKKLLLLRVSLSVFVFIQGHVTAVERRPALVWA